MKASYTPHQAKLRWCFILLSLMIGFAAGCGGQAVDGTEFGDNNGFNQNSNGTTSGGTDLADTDNIGVDGSESSNDTREPGEDDANDFTDTAIPEDADQDNDGSNPEDVQNDIDEDIGDAQNDVLDDVTPDVQNDAANDVEIDAEVDAVDDTNVSDVQDDVAEPDLPADDPLEALNDDFEADSLDAWTIMNPEASAVAIVDGQLRLEPAARSVWFQGNSGVLVAKEIEGDFRVTSYVSARQRSNPELPPTPSFQLGGLIARNPDTTEGENYVFLVVGADDNDVSLETKTTVNSNSTYEGPAWPSGEGELRICRVGSTFRLYARETEGAWSLRATYDRTDLPATLQVGALAYANTNTPDVTISYASMTFASVDGVDGCLD